MPHTIQVPQAEPLLALYAWTGQLGGQFWFGDSECGEEFAGDINKIEDPEEYYDKMAGNYEQVVRGWGYNMPEVVSDKISEYTMAQDSKTVLDLGCGDGLVGEALSCRGFTRITGLDIAGKMLKVASGRGVYQELKQADLMKTLPVESATFDIVSCVG